SGDGGDELFAGYPRYHLLKRIWRSMNVVPYIVRCGFGALLRGTPERLFDQVGGLLPAAAHLVNAGRKARRLGQLLTVGEGDSLILQSAAIWPNERLLLQGELGPYEHRPEPVLAEEIPDFVSRMQYYDTLAYLPDDVMTKVDRCSMAVALEAREP